MTMRARGLEMVEEEKGIAGWPGLWAFMAVQILSLGAKHVLRRGRCEQNRTVAVMTRDDVGHVLSQQPIAILLGTMQVDARARELLDHERDPGDEEQG